MYISYIVYIILNSRCYTGGRAPKLSHRSSYIKEPFGKGLDGLPGGWTGASEGLEGGLRGLRPIQGGLKGAEEGLQGGLRRASRWQASRGLEEGLERGFKQASRGLQRGLEGGLKVKGASRGLQGGLRRASRGLEKGFKGASRGLQALLTFVPPPREGTLQAGLEGYLRRWWLGSSPRKVFETKNGRVKSTHWSVWQSCFWGCDMTLGTCPAASKVRQKPWNH